MAELDQKMKEAIDNYGNEITTLKDFVTACRMRPGQFIGPIGGPGFLNMMREIFQNAIDQIMDPTSPGNWFRFSYDERTLEVEVEDNGKGFPFNEMIRMLTKEYTSKNYVRKPGEYSAGLNGIGLKATNALTTTLTIKSYRYDGTAAQIQTKCGYPTTKEPVMIPNKSKKQGTVVTFFPDSSVLGEIQLPWKIVYTLIKQIVSLIPIGSRCDFEAIDINGKRFTENIVNKDGIITDLIMRTQKPLVKPIIVNVDDGYHKLECAFCWDASEDALNDFESVTSFSNLCPTKEGSTHIDGTLEGICKWFMNYMNNIYLINQKSKDKLKITPNDIKHGLVVMISACHLYPEFTGQAKEILSNKDMIPFCRDAVMAALDAWSKSYPQDLQKLARLFKEIGELRMKDESSRAKIIKKYQSNVLTGLPQKYVKPLGKKDIELIIVEGESAKGNIVEGRDPQTQGVYPIRGKISNAFRNSKTEFFSNEEVQGIIKIVFGEEWKPGKKFTIDDCKVSKVIFMADADVDRITVRKYFSQNHAGNY